MTDTEYEKLKADEAKAYADYDMAQTVLHKLGEIWLPFRQALDKENMRRQVRAEMEKEKT